MKNLKFLQMMILLVSLCSCDSCKDEEWTALPPETQTGANTFGCYVNNELFVAQKKYAPLGGKYLSAVYSRSAKILTINAYGKNTDCGIGILNPEKGINTMLGAHYVKGIIHYSEQYNDNLGMVYLTRFDSISNVVSGTFSCKIKLLHAYLGIEEGDSVIITQGRFDIKLDIYDN